MNMYFESCSKPDLMVEGSSIYFVCMYVCVHVYVGVGENPGPRTS